MPKPLFTVVKAFLYRFTGVQAGVSLLEDNAYRTITYQPTSIKIGLVVSAAVLPAGIAAGYLSAQQNDSDDDDDIDWSDEDDEDDTYTGW